MEFITRENLAENLWNQCIADAENCRIYGLTWYLDIVSPGWEAWVISENNKYDACLALPVKKKLGIINALMQPVFVQQAGVFSNNQEKFEIGTDFLSQKIKGYAWADFQITGKHALPQYLKTKERINFTLDLNKPYEQLFAAYKQTKRYDIRQAEKANLFIEETSDGRDLIKIFQESRAGREANLNKITLYRLEQLMQSAVFQANGFTWLVRDTTGKIHAGGFFLHFKERVYYLFGASSELGRKSFASSWLIDKAIQRFSGNL